MSHQTRTLSLSLSIIAVALVFAYVPTPVSQQSMVVVSGTDLQELLMQLEEQFEATHPTLMWM